MKNFKTIQLHCESNSSIISDFVDDFLLYYCDSREGIEKKVRKKLTRYSDVMRGMPKGWDNYLVSEAIAYELFRKDGCAGKYRNHAQIKECSSTEQQFLEQQIATPWRFSFSTIVGEPHNDFYEMQDVITDEKFLLYSPSITRIEEMSGKCMLYFNLLGFNGMCWQSYGTVAHFKALMAEDIFHFARCLDPNITFLSEVLDVIDKDFLPFALLWSGAEIPIIKHKKDIFRQNISEYHEDSFNVEAYRETFFIHDKKPLFKLELKRWRDMPHYASVYYHEKHKRLIISAMTDRGYAQLVKALNDKNYALPQEPEHRVSVNMLNLEQSILNKKENLNPYESQFETAEEPEDEAFLEKGNSFIEVMVEAYNKGDTPNVHALADKIGISREDAEDLAEAFFSSIQKSFKDTDRPVSKSRKSNKQTTYTLRVELDASRPKIWREFKVSSDILLTDFHKVLQTVMGWENSHLYMFQADGLTYQVKDEFSIDFEDMMPPGPEKDIEEIALYEVLNENCNEMEYSYDFGDGWAHTITLEKVSEESLKHPICLSGKNSCPPEDCGGIWGYKDILKILKKGPAHEEYDHLKEWLGDYFEPTYFVKEEVNSSLRLKNYGCFTFE